MMDFGSAVRGIVIACTITGTLGMILGYVARGRIKEQKRSCRRCTVKQEQTQLNTCSTHRPDWAVKEKLGERGGLVYTMVSLSIPGH